MQHTESPIHHSAGTDYWAQNARLMDRARRTRAAFVRALVGAAETRLGSLAWRLLVAPARRWRDHQRLVEELSSMDERALADIGLSRGDVPAVLDGSYRGEERRARQRAVAAAADRAADAGQGTTTADHAEHGDEHPLAA